MRVLRFKWRRALLPGMDLPPYEEVVLGNLGRLADRFLFATGESPDTFRVMQAGRYISDWLGAGIEGALVRDLPADCSLSLVDTLDQALRAREPVSAIAHRVRNGTVETCDVLALPLASRWGPPVVAAYVREGEARYNLVEAIFRSTNDAMFALAPTRKPACVSAEMQIVAVNESAAQLTGMPERDMMWRRLSDILPAFGSADFSGRMHRSLESGAQQDFELTVARNGLEVHLKAGVASIGNLLTLTLTDVGGLKRSEASFRLLFDGNPVPMWLYDPDTLRFVNVNDAAIAHYGHGREAFLAMELPDIWPADERELHREIARSVDTEYQSDRTWRHIKSDGTEIEVLTYARRMRFAERPAVLVAVLDVTERRRAEARIAHMAHHDALTELPNRVLFQERLGEALGQRRTAAKLAVFCVDLDNFKSVNDTLGHPIGDSLLRQVAQRLRLCARAEELIARLGGDEFAVIQPEIATPQEAIGLATRMIESLAKPFEIEGHELIVGASIGIALAPGDGEDANLLLRNADMALYRAKAEGRGTLHFFEPEMDRSIQARRSLEMALRKAYSRGEFELFYQPLLCLNSNRVTGCEALLRWRSPERGLISPADFIPVAEEIGLIVPIGEWVLREACREAATWPGDIKVAVNLSPVQFRSRHLVQAVVSALAHSRLPPHRLELEITETVLLGDSEANIATLHQLRAIGAHIAMDDFGTGYSSLSYLRTFPFDKIKIDRSFINELAARPDCAAIVRAVVGLGTSLGIRTTAEGVETAEQLDRLQNEGCTEAQGYLISPPKPAHEIMPLLLAGRAKARVA